MGTIARHGLKLRKSRGSNHGMQTKTNWKTKAEEVITIKYCSKCKESKSILLFGKDKRRKDGYSLYCTECTNKISRKNYANNVSSRTVSRNLWRDNNIDHIRAIHTITNHRRKGNIINVSINYVMELFKNTTHCNICGVELLKTIENKIPMETSPSLDRIDNSNELNENNIWIICHQCNATKRNRTIDEFYEYCKLILSRRK